MLWGVHFSNCLASTSPLMFNWFSIAAIALVYWRSKKVCSYGCVQQTHLKQIFVSSSPFKKFIGTMLGGVHFSNSVAEASPLIFNLFTTAAIELVYWRSKKVCSYGCVRRTHLKQILGSYSPSKKFIGTMLGVVHLSNNLAAASPLIFNWYIVASIALVYWRSKKVCSYGYVRQTHILLISGRSSPSKKFIGTMLVGVHLSNSLAAASPLIFNWFAIAAVALVYCRSKKVCNYGCVRRTHI